MTSGARAGSATGTVAATAGAALDAARRRAKQLSANAARALDTDRIVSWWTILVAALPPSLVVLAWLIADALQAHTYSPVRQSISVLAGRAGHDRWVMTGAFYLASLCYLAIAVGLHGIRVTARVLLVVAAIAGIGIAACPEPTHGSTDQHLAWTALGAVAIAAWPSFASAIGPRRVAHGPLAPGNPTVVIVSIGYLGLLIWLTFEARYGHALGLAERVCMAVQTSWPLVIAVIMRYSTARTRRREGYEVAHA